MRIIPEFDSRDFEEQADRLHADLRRAQVRGLNAAAQRVLDGLRRSMDEHLDEPTERTLSGLTATQARSGRAPEVTVGVKPEIADYSQYAAHGGTQRDIVIPTADAPLDRHGNFRRGYLRTVEARGGFWTVSQSGVRTLFEPDGAGGIRAVAFRVDRADCSPVWDFEGEAADLVAEALPEEIRKAFERVLNDDCALVAVSAGGQPSERDARGRDGRLRQTG